MKRIIFKNLKEACMYIKEKYFNKEANFRKDIRKHIRR